MKVNSKSSKGSAKLDAGKLWWRLFEMVEGNIVNANAQGSKQIDVAIGMTGGTSPS